MNLELKNKIVFIAGSSDGLGFSTALEFAREGAKVILTGRFSERLKTAEEKIRALFPEANLLSCVVDLQNAEQTKAAVQTAVATLGGLDILITNAGGPPVKAFEILTEEDWNTGFQLTLMSVVRLIREALPVLRLSSAPSILTITSTSGKEPIPGLLLSNVFRPAILGLTKALSVELAPDNIRVNSILPGWTATDRSKSLVESYATKNKSSIAEETDRIANNVPLGRMATPEEFARAAVFISSPAASYITGVMLPVDGGKIKGI